MPNIINLSSPDLIISSRLANKTEQKYGLLSKLSLAVIGACEVAKNLHIFLTIAKQHIQEINRHSDGKLDNFGFVAFAKIKNKMNPTPLSTCCCNQTSPILFLSFFKKVELHEHRNHWALITNSEVDYKHNGSCAHVIQLFF